MTDGSDGGQAVRRCAAHGLAADPDGRCVRCHRAEPRDLRGALRVVIVTCVLGAVALVVHGSTRHGEERPAAPTEAQAPVRVVPAEAAAAPPAPPPPRPYVGPPSPSVQVAAAPPIVDEAEAHRQADEAYVAAARARRAQDARAQARAAVQVVMYSTSWCGYCARARAWLGREGIAYVDHDVEREPDASARMRTLNPRGGVPTFEIDGLVERGFDAGSLGRAIALAAARRADAVR